jgi:hypothetical protein
MFLSSTRPALIITVLAAITWPARAGERDQLNACQAMVDRAARSAQKAGDDDAELQRCRQIIKEWTLRDSRRSVDEQGRPLR